MIYSVTFSFHDSETANKEIRFAHRLFKELQNEKLSSEYKILQDQKKVATYLALVYFEDENHFDLAMRRIAEIGVHSGNHGKMIKRVFEFSVGFYNDVSSPINQNG